MVRSTEDFLHFGHSHFLSGDGSTDVDPVGFSQKDVPAVHREHAFCRIAVDLIDKIIVDGSVDAVGPVNSVPPQNNVVVRSATEIFSKTFVV